MLALAIGIGVLLTLAVLLYRWQTAGRESMLHELKQSEKELFRSIEATTAKLLGQ
jgi:hypothetical protein